MGIQDCVPISHAQLACDWCDYLETHASRVYSAQARPEHHAAIALSKRLAKGWKREDGFFTVRDVYRSGWTALDSPDAARGALLVLEEYGWVRRETDTADSRTAQRNLSHQSEDRGEPCWQVDGWRDWSPSAIIQECPEHQLTKPTKPFHVTILSVLSVPISARFKNI